ncbi:lysozyme inhibitor LprI family protein [Methyloligella solikamskensis]|uniref:Lysozyme inhibitor LprI family protein n=1 Tax=Methyloligella solikamskensis TaxID=1177756 RepID=A0ABW3J739_9HYPH
MPRKVIAAFLIATATTILTSSAEAAQPSFNCAKANAADEKAICADDKLAQMDQAVAIAYGQLTPAMKKDAKTMMRQSLANRAQCGSDKLCILNNQADQLVMLQDFGADVPMPPWVGRYVLTLFEQSGAKLTKGMPGKVGRCTKSKIASITTRFGEELVEPEDELDSSGSAVTYANGGYQVSYDYIPELAASEIGDEVLICLVSLPEDCPPGDDRGKYYSTTNVRTGGAWSLPDSQHMCGGA